MSRMLNDEFRREFRRIPSALHREHVNGKSASKHDHIPIEQIHVGVVFSFSGATAAKTMQVDMLEVKECCRLTLPTTDRQQAH